MLEVSTTGVDLAKNALQAHGADASGTTLFRKKLLCLFGFHPSPRHVGCRHSPE
jgi:hypothetical protein